MLQLSEDRVANVRLATARTLSQLVSSADGSPLFQSERLREVENNLRNDGDVDVRSWLGGSEERHSARSEVSALMVAEAVTELDVDDAEVREEEEARRRQELGL